LSTARALIDETTVMSDSERAKATEIVDDARTAKTSRRNAKPKKRASKRR
jgi:hypothetical protein